MNYNNRLAFLTAYTTLCTALWRTLKYGNCITNIVQQTLYNNM